MRQPRVQVISYIAGPLCVELFNVKKYPPSWRNPSRTTRHTQEIGRQQLNCELSTITSIECSWCHSKQRHWFEANVLQKHFGKKRVHQLHTNAEYEFLYKKVHGRCQTAGSLLKRKLSFRPWVTLDKLVMVLKALTLRRAH